MTSDPGIEPGPHWWEGSALTTALTLLPNTKFMSQQTAEVYSKSLWTQKFVSRVSTILQDEDSGAFFIASQKLCRRLFVFFQESSVAFDGVFTVIVLVRFSTKQRPWWDSLQTLLAFSSVSDHVLDVFKWVHVVLERVFVFGSQV